MTNTLKEAALSAPRVEPVAWQYRIQYPDGGWSDWMACKKTMHDTYRFMGNAGKCPAETRELGPLYAAPPSQPDTPARRQADIVTGAMAIARSRGHDPEEPAPLTEMCTEDNAPVPWWMVFVEESEACLKAVSYAAQPDTGAREAEVVRWRQRAAQAEAVLEFIVAGYDNQYINHVDFRVEVYKAALSALPPDAGDKK